VRWIAIRHDDAVSTPSGSCGPGRYTGSQFSGPPPSRANAQWPGASREEAPMANPHLLTVAGAAQALHLFPVQPGRFHPGAGTRGRAMGKHAYGRPASPLRRRF